MLKLECIVCICLAALPAFPQTASKWQVGTVVDVKIHEIAEPDDFGTVSYDVSLKVGNTVYLVLYTPPMGDSTVKYVAGRDLLVLVGKSTIRYNDLLGQSHEAPIEAQRPATNAAAISQPTAAHAKHAMPH